MPQPIYVYHIPPIDYGWCWLQPLRSLNGIYEELDKHEELKAIAKFQDRAEVLARRLGWDGDNRIEPHVFFVPDELEMSLGLVWKQDNNGCTFVASPVQLPHLEAEAGSEWLCT